MKILVVDREGSLRPLARVMEQEGDEVKYSRAVIPPDGHELVLTDWRLPGSGVPTITFGQQVPRKVLEAMGWEVGEDSAFFATKWFDHTSDSPWGEQLALGIPLTTLMAHDLGPSCEAGCALRYVWNAPRVDTVRDS